MGPIFCGGSNPTQLVLIKIPTKLRKTELKTPGNKQSNNRSLQSGPAPI